MSGVIFELDVVSFGYGFIAAFAFLWLLFVIYAYMESKSPTKSHADK